MVVTEFVEVEADSWIDSVIEKGEDEENHPPLPPRPEKETNI